jgi:LacI family transcriptional regulator
MAQQMSIREFAALAHVSPATVSRVFSGTTPVSPEVRQSVLSLAQKYRFRPNVAARAAFGGKTGSVGVFLPDVRDTYFADIAAGISETLLATDRLPIILEARTDPDRKAIRRLVDHRVDGVILTPVDESVQRDELETILRYDLPVVVVDSPRGLARDSVLNDDHQTGLLAGRHLLELGHRRMGFCYLGEGASACDIRLAAFREALAAADVVLKDTSIARLPARETNPEISLMRQLRELLQSPERPTAIFSPSDLLALHVYSVCRELKLRIPHDLSVVGCGDLTFAPFLSPALTTVRQDGLTIGRLAAQAMLKRMEDPEAPGTKQLLPTQLIVRESTCPPART